MSACTACNGSGKHLFGLQAVDCSFCAGTGLWPLPPACVGCGRTQKAPLVNLNGRAMCLPCCSAELVRQSRDEGGPDPGGADSPVVVRIAE